MIRIIFNSLPVPAGRFRYTFTNKTPLYEATYTSFHAIEFGNFKFGNAGSDDELKFKAANSMFEFYIPGQPDWHTVLDVLFNNETLVDVLLNNQPVFSGIVDNESVTGSYLKQTIKLTITDSFISKPPLIDVDCTSICNSLGRPNDILDLNNRVIPLVPLIARLSYEHFGLMLNYKCKTRLKYFLWDFSSYYDTYEGDGSGLRNLAGWFGNLLSPSLYNYDAKKIIKSLCNVLCSYAITGFDKKLYILPLYYRGPNSGYGSDPDLITLNKDQFAGDPEPFCLKTKKFLKINYLDNKKNYGDNNRWLTYYSPSEPDADTTSAKDIAEIFLPLYAGSFDNDNGWSKTAFHIDTSDPNYICALGTDKTSVYRNGAFTTEGALGYLSQYFIYYFLNKNKTGYKLTLEGTGYKVYNVFKMPGNDKIFRTKRMEYDFLNNKTVVEIIEY